MKRIIKVTVTYDLDESWLKKLQITAKEIVKEIVSEEMEEVFSEDEGFEGVEVEIIDIP